MSDQRIDDLRELWRTELRRVEDVLKIRLEQLEARVAALETPMTRRKTVEQAMADWAADIAALRQKLERLERDRPQVNAVSTTRLDT